MADQNTRISPETLIAEYQRGQQYNSGIDLTDRVQRSEDFFIGNQWKDVNAPDLDKPVFNILKRVGNFFISNIVSDDIGISLEPFFRQEEPTLSPAAPLAGAGGAPMGAGAGAMPGDGLAGLPGLAGPEGGPAGLMGMQSGPAAGPAGGAVWTAQQLGDQLPQLLKRQLDQAMEMMKVKPKHRYFLRDALVDGDGCFHFFFDPDADPQGYRGAVGTPGMIRCELLDNTGVYFGNPQSQDVQSQPYLLLQFRVPVEKAKETARKNGAENWQSIGENQDEGGVNLDDETGKTTVLRRYWKAKAAGAAKAGGGVSPREDGVENGGPAREAVDERGQAGGAESTREAARLMGAVGAESTREAARHDGARRMGAADAAAESEGGEEHVWFCEASADGVEITPPTDTGLTLYPLVWMCWERVKNRYHGQSAVEGLLPNQIAINKLYAMAIQSVKLTAFPKIVYDKTKMAQYSNRVGDVVGVTGDPTRAVAAAIQGANMSPQVTALLQDVISTTRDTMGASDAALGNINPENTSAIIAVQRATSMPLELQKLDFYRIVEDEVRIWLDMMAACYGVRPVDVEVPAGMQAGGMLPPGGAMGLAGMMAGPGMMGPQAERKPRTQRVLFDFGSLAGMAMRLNVEIGGASYWSELNEVSTADALISKGIITDPLDYLERVPDGYIKDKAGLIESIEAQRRQAEQLQQAQAMMQMGMGGGMGAGGMPAGAPVPQAPGGAGMPGAMG